MTTTLHRLRIIAGLLTCFIGTELTGVPIAFAQTGGSQYASHIKLTTIVRLDLGNTTVANVMTALSEQTGLTITASAYLVERRLIIRMDNVPAEAVLDALDELNDWVWYPTLPGKILVTRSKLQLDATPAAIPRLMQAALPKDLRTYLSIPTPNNDLSKYVSMFDSNLYDIHTRFGDRLSRSVAIDQSDLLNSLAPKILTGEPIAYLRLTEKQRAELVESLVFPKLRSTDYQLLHNDLLPHVADVNNAVLKLAGRNNLLIGSVISDGKTDSEIGFGAEIR